MLLVLSLATTVVTIYSMNTKCQENPDLTEERRGQIIIGLSLAASGVAAITTYLKPAERWMQLRGSALSLESEIWKFRTRSGAYMIGTHKDSAESSLPERKLHEVLETVQQHIAKAGNVNETTFYSSLEIFGGVRNKSGERVPEHMNIYRHGQYKGCRIDGTFGSPNEPGSVADDHHKPINPDMYLQLRVEPLVRFYQRRLPRYYWVRTIIEVIIILGALSGTLLVFLNADEWVAIITTCTVSLTAWINFQNTSRKLTRYSNLVESIAAVVLWWKSLTHVDKANVENVNEFVTACEDIFGREREAWMSTSMKIARLQQQNDAQEEESSE